MNYKNIFLSFLLAQFSFSLCNDIEIQIQQLREDLFNKELQLSKIGKEIEEQEQLIESMLDKVISILSQISRNEEEKKDFLVRFNAVEERFSKAIAAGNVQNFITAELFNEENQSVKIKRIKSIVMRSFIENEILKKLIQNYENNLQTIAEIICQLNKLKK